VESYGHRKMNILALKGLFIVYLLYPSCIHKGGGSPISVATPSDSESIYVLTASRGNSQFLKENIIVN